MKQLIFVLFILVMGSHFTSAQDHPKTKADHYLEGGQLLVDIVKVFKNGKRSRAEDCNPQISKLCFQNKGLVPIEVLISYKGTIDVEPAELLIPAKGKECTYLIVQGIYKYEIALEAKDGLFKTSQKGEFNVKDCLEVLVKIGGE